MKKLLLLLPLTLVACNSITQQQVDTKIDETVPVACAGVDLAWAAFEAYKAGHTVKADLAVKANAAYFAAKDVCANPPHDSASALFAVLGAASTFNAAVKNAKSD